MAFSVEIHSSPKILFNYNQLSHYLYARKYYYRLTILRLMFGSKTPGDYMTVKIYCLMRVLRPF